MTQRARARRLERIMAKLFDALTFRLFLAWAFFASIGVVLFRRLTKGRAHPSWSLPYEVAVDLVRRFMLHGLEELRAGKPASEAPVPRHPRLMRSVALTHKKLAGQRAEIHARHNLPERAPTFLYWHGGGYAACSPRTHRDLLSAIALTSGARVIAPCYPMVPHASFPAAPEAAVACYRELLASGISPDDLIVGGDSAGGGLSLAMLMKLREAGDPLPRAVVLLSPWVDLEVTGASIKAHAQYDYMDPVMIDQGSRWYAGEESRRHPHISPIHADLTGLPPMLILTGGVEVFRSENELLVEKLREAGVDVTHEIAENAVHVFPLLSIVSKQSREARHRIGQFVRAQLSAADAVRAA